MEIFEIIIAPFIFLIKQTFLFSHQLTGNYGISIILLSFVISLILLPIFILIEKSKKKDDAVKAKMKPLLDEIKRCYKGQERHYYIKTLNRQHQYNPLRSLIPILSLLLQIPFFIAAYQFLEFFKPLEGVSFLFIDDLAEADGLLGSINILPIAMTVVNLLTAYFYTRNGDKSELKQMLVVAALFLVLLFKLPAGLVLYWTMNNMFSFFRLFITNPEVFKRKLDIKNKLTKQIQIAKTRLTPAYPKLKLTFIFILFTLLLIEFNRGLSIGFTNITNQIATSFALSLGITLFASLLTMVHKVNITTINKVNKQVLLKIWPSFKPVFLLIFISTGLSQINWALQYNFNSIVQRLFGCFAGSIAVTAVIALIVLSYQGQLQIKLNPKLHKPSQLSSKLKSLLVILIIATTALHLGLALKYGISNLIFKLVASVIVSWIIVVVLSNISAIKNWLQQALSAVIKVQIPNKVYASIWFLVLYFYMAGSFYYSGNHATLTLLGFILIITLELLSIWQYSKTNTRRKNTLLRITNFVFIALIIFQLWQFISASTNGSTYAHQTIIAGLTFCIFSYFHLYQDELKSIEPTKKAFALPYILSLLYILGIIFFWNPLIVYSSFPEIFSFPAIKIFSKNLPLFALLLSGGIALYFIVPKKIKFLLSTLVTTSAILFFVNSFIIPINVGTLQLGKYIEAQNMAMEPIVFITEGLFILLAFWGTRKLLAGKYFKHLAITISALMLIVMNQSILIAINKGEFYVKSDQALNLPSNITFSKTEQNIVFFIPDMFMGMHMKYILEDHPELKEELDGFTWYPNTLSVSTNTCPSISSLLAGHEHNLNQLNKDKKRTMTEKITEATQIFTAKVKEQNYSLTSTQMVYSELDKKTYNAYLPNWHSDWNKYNQKLNIGGAKELDYAILWKNALFYGAPLALKPAIYKNGHWIKIEKETNKNTSISQRYNFVRLLPYISDTASQKGSFTYIHSEATHGPWNIVNDQGELIMDVSSYTNQLWFLNQFIKWIKWMKENDVYDNTKIVMVADHSHFLPNEELSEYGGKYKWDNKGLNKVSAKDFWRVNGLLMVKDFNTNGEIKEDWRFMSNADAPAIAFNENDPTKGSAPKSRTLPVFFLDNKPAYLKATKLDLGNNYLVTDSVYDARNWKKIEESDY